MKTQPPVPQGDPTATICRWCNGIKAGHNGALVCARCDSPQAPGGEIVVATWAEATASAPCDVGDKVRVIRGSLKDQIGMMTERDTEQAVGTVIISDVNYVIPLRDLRRAK